LRTGGHALLIAGHPSILSSTVLAILGGRIVAWIEREISVSVCSYTSECFTVSHSCHSGSGHISSQKLKDTKQDIRYSQYSFLT
jgi:hypothetical protein